MRGRWGGSVFEMNQARRSCVNPLGGDAEPKTSASHRTEAIKQKEFHSMIDGNLPQDKYGNFKKADVDACLMRRHIVALTPKWIDYRLAESGDALVLRMAYADPARPELWQSSVREKYMHAGARCQRACPPVLPRASVPQTRGRAGRQVRVPPPPLSLHCFGARLSACQPDHVTATASCGSGYPEYPPGIAPGSK